MQEATTFNNFYNGISFQHLATLLISVFTLCYGPGLLFRGPLSSTYWNLNGFGLNSWWMNWLILRIYLRDPTSLGSAMRRCWPNTTVSYLFHNSQPLFPVAMPNAFRFLYIIHPYITCYSRVGNIINYFYFYNRNLFFHVRPVTSCRAPIPIFIFYIT